MLGTTAPVRLTYGYTAAENFRPVSLQTGVSPTYTNLCKLSALATRAHIAHLSQHYLCPLTLTGDTGQDLLQWIAAPGTAEQASVSRLH